MSGHLMRTSVVRGALLGQRALGTSAARSAGHPVMTEESPHDRHHPKLGNRDIVGFGFNGSASYADREEFPCPAVRFRENTPEVMALREKEKGDWKHLTLEEKKNLYRASFCQTFAEMKAPTGEWKSVVAAILTALGITGWIVLWMKTSVYQAMPSTITEEWQEAQLEKMIKQGQGRVQGVSSMWDYDRECWKK